MSKVLRSYNFLHKNFQELSKHSIQSINTNSTYAKCNRQAHRFTPRYLCDLTHLTTTFAMTNLNSVPQVKDCHDYRKSRAFALIYPTLMKPTPSITRSVHQTGAPRILCCIKTAIFSEGLLHRERM